MIKLYKSDRYVGEPNGKQTSWTKVRS